MSCSLSARCFQTSGRSGGGEVHPKDPHFKWQGKHQSFFPSIPHPLVISLSAVTCPLAWYMCYALHLGIWPRPLSHIKQSISCCPFSIILLQERALYPHYLWVLWHDLPFSVAPDASLYLGHCLLHGWDLPTNQNQHLRPWPMKVFLHPRLLHFPFQDVTTEIKHPQKPLICACVLPMDYCLPWFWVLALLQSEYVAGHESLRAKDIPVLAILNICFFFFYREERFSLSGKC